MTTEAIEGCGAVQKTSVAAAIIEISAPTPSTARGPKRSVSRPLNGAPTPEARPRITTR